jgi:aryl-alcohol dehydrogenase-like predicted oxidoreductase
MKYRKLGNTGLIVSEVAQGSMQFGTKMNMGNLGQENTLSWPWTTELISSMRQTFIVLARAKHFWVMP